MPCPLPPLPRPVLKRLSFIPSNKLAPPPSVGLRPVVTYIVQLEANFDPVLGEGEWRYIQYPRNVHFDDWEEFERFVYRHLPYPKDQMPVLLDYLHNFKILNLDLSTGEVYPPNLESGSTGFEDRDNSFTSPIPPSPGPYIQGGGHGNT